MKKKQPSNVFTLPKWMTNLRAREPEGTYTPDQVSAVLEMNLLLNGDVESLRASIQTLIPLVPLKRQQTLKAFLSAPDCDIITVVQAFIEMVNIKLAPILKEAAHVEPRKEELPAGGFSSPASGPSEHHESHLPEDWGDDDWGGPRGPKPSTRGLRALRASKRGQADL